MCRWAIVPDIESGRTSGCVGGLQRDVKVAQGRPGSRTRVRILRRFGTARHEETESERSASANVPHDATTAAARGWLRVRWGQSTYRLIGTAYAIQTSTSATV